MYVNVTENELMTTTAAGAVGYACTGNSPCSQGDGYYAHAISSKYILCSNFVCAEHDCAPAQVWDQVQQTCVWASM